MHESLQSRWYRTVEQAPDEPALAFYEADGTHRWRSREDVLHEAAGRAAALATAGLRAGDACVIVLPSGALAASVLLGTLITGARPLLVAPPAIQGVHSGLADTLHAVVGRTGARVVVCPEAMADERAALADAHPGTRFVFGEDELPHEPEQAPAFALPLRDDVAAHQLTSGTTGSPRICVWTQERVLAALDGMVAAMDVDERDIYLNWTPLYHDMGLMNNFMLCLTAGIPLVMMSPFTFVRRPATWLRALSETGATTTWSPNFGFALATQRVRDAELDGVRLDHVRGFWNAAERIHLSTIEAFHERFAAYGVRLAALKTNFGCAENVGGATFSRTGDGFSVEYVDPVALYEEQVARPTSRCGSTAIPVVGTGVPHPGIRLAILDDAGEPLPEGSVGEVALDTPSAMTGYLGDPDATASAFHGRWLLTGDLGYLRDGELFWTGRSRERIAVHGRKLDPSDFEAPLTAVTELRPGAFVAFGVDDARLGTERIVILAEVREGAAFDPDELTGRVRQEVLAHLGVNADEVALLAQGTLTRTSSGKRRNRFFAERYLRGGLDAYRVDARLDTAPV